MNFYARAGSNPGLLLTPKQGRGRLRICGGVNKEKGFAKAVLKRACKNIPVNGV